MIIKKEMASIGLDPFNATIAYGIQSKAVSKYKNSTYINLIYSSFRTLMVLKVFREEPTQTCFDFFNQRFHIIMRGGSHD